MNIQVVRTLLKKDLTLFINDRFYFYLTIIGLVFYIGLYFVMPSKVDEKISLGVYAPVLPPAFSQAVSPEGTDVRFFQDEEDLKDAILKGDLMAGVALTPEALMDWEDGQIPTIYIYYDSASPPEISAAISTLIKEFAYSQTGQILVYDTSEQILGHDMIGRQIPMRDRMLPLLASFLLLTEMLSLAALIAIEVEQGTIRAILSTPLRVSELFLAKGILGVTLAFAQVALFLGVIGGLNQQPVAMLVTLFFGSLLVVGIGFLLAALSRDVMAVTGWGVLFMIFLAIPAIGHIVPGLLADWAKVIPSYYLTDSFSRIANYGAGLVDILPNLGILAGMTVVLYAAGIAVLRRRYL